MSVLCNHEDETVREFVLHDPDASCFSSLKTLRWCEGCGAINIDGKWQDSSIAISLMFRSVPQWIDKARWRP